LERKNIRSKKQSYQWQGRKKKAGNLSEELGVGLIPSKRSRKAPSNVQENKEKKTALTKNEKH